MRELQVNAADEIRIFMVSSSDHITPVTGATVAVSLLKKGQTAFAAGAGTVTEAGGGWYIYYATAADTNTFGPLAVRAVAAGCDAFNTEYQVKYANPYVKSTVKADEFSSSLNLTTNMANEVASRCGLALTNYGAATASALATVDTIVDAILVDTGTTIPAQITGLNDTTAQEVWEYATRSLTDKSGFSLTQSFPANFASLDINASGHISRVVLVDTTTTNTDMRGTDNAITSLTGIATSTNISDLQTHGDTNWATADVSGLATAVALATVDSNIDSILVDTGTTLPNQITALNDITAQEVWEYVTRTLTSSGSGGATAQEVWEYATRALTDKTDFVLSSAGVSTVQSGLATASQLTEVQKYVEADIVIDTTTTPYKMIIKQKGTETVLGTKELYDVNGDPIDSLTTFWGQQKEA